VTVASHILFAGRAFACHDPPLTSSGPVDPG